MKKHLLLIIAIWLTGVYAMAQTPSLSVKGTLDETLLSTPRGFTNALAVDTMEIPFSYQGDFTIEVKGKVTSAVGRGLDIEARKSDKSGFRTSVSPDKFRWTSSLNSQSVLNLSSTAEQTFRYAVEGNSVHIYQNGTYIDTKSLTTINNIVNDAEVDPTGVSDATNLIPNIFGGTSNVKPDAIGWGNNGAGTVPWITAGGGSGVRFQDNFNGLTYNGTQYAGRAFIVRWESGVTNGSHYYYPVTLAANTTYNFSFMYAYWNNGSPGAIKFSVSKETTGDNILKEVTYNDWDKQTLDKGALTFTTEDAGTYYLMVSSETAGLWVLADLQLHKYSLDPRIVIGKNYTDGAVDMSVSSVTYDNTGAYAPEISGSSEQLPVSISDEKFDIAAFINSKVTVQSGVKEVHLTSTDPLRNSTVNLLSTDTWLYFDAVIPSKTVANLLQNVTINGQPVGDNDRIAIYGSGAVIIPNGKLTAKEALTAYTEPNFGGQSKSFEINTYHNALGDFDNKIQSFKLKKGFSATLANNPDGTGFSRVFIASDEDLEVPLLPEGMEGFVSFIRVFKWEWTSKKGWAGGVGSDALTEAAPSISYDWDAAGNTENIDTEYVPMRHNLGWQSFEIINSRENVSHVLGYNEPERPDQSDMSVEDAIGQWPELFKSGLRIGSPVPSSTPHSWLNQFMAICDSLNYRVDFVVSHAYQYQPTSWWDWMIPATSTAAFSNGRPVWITEWNNGANWTSESWPTASGPQRDADLNIIYDDGGNEITVNKPLSPENAERQRAKLLEIMNHMETIDKLEHHFIYNWVQDARALELGGKLTPAGKAFANFKSEVGFKKANEYIHTWKIAPPWATQTLSDDYKSFTLKWKDHNGETGVNYIVERKLSTESNYTVVATLVAGTDYTVAGEVEYSERLAFNKASYRIKATSYKGTESIYSRDWIVQKDADAAPPVLKGEAVSSTINKIEWDAVENARSYNVKRATEIRGTYETIAEAYAETTYEDKDLQKNTTYFYKVSCVNSSGEGVDSQPLELTTKALEAPGTIANFYVASGDASAILTWDFTYDVLYTIYRSDAADGTYTTVVDSYNGSRYVDKSNISNGSTYYYKIVGKNSIGESPESEILVAQPGKGQHLHLTFNENTGAVAYDEWGGYHGTLEDGAEWTTGEDGSVVSLSTTNKSYIRLKEDVVSDLDDFTIATWFKGPERGNSRVFDFGNGTGIFMVLVPRYSATQARYKITCPAGTYTADMDCVIPDDRWVHIALTQEGKVLKFYMDGQLVYTGENTEGVNPSHMGPTPNNYLGRSQWPSDPYTNQTYDDFSIYNYALNAKIIAKLANWETIPNADGVKLNQLTVNGEVWDTKNDYILGCENNPSQLVLDIDTDQDVSVVYEDNVMTNNQIVIDNVGSISSKEIEFTLLADDGRESSFTLSLERYIPFDNLVIQRWNNTLLVNNNSTTNGGYSFKAYKWYKNGVQVGTNQYYSAGSKSSDLLDASANYHVQVTKTDDTELRTCASTVTLRGMDVKLYPNPVTAGQAINVELDLDQETIKDSTIDIYDISGNRISSRKVGGASTTISAPNTSGTYVVKIKSNNFSKETKIIVK